jgi:hypothetical protein
LATAWLLQSLRRTPSTHEQQQTSTFINVLFSAVDAALGEREIEIRFDADH